MNVAVIHKSEMIRPCLDTGNTAINKPCKSYSLISYSK